MLYCKLHGRLYMPPFGWIALTQVTDSLTFHGMLMIEGACDICVQEAKESLKAQFPHLYVHTTLQSSV